MRIHNNKLGNQILSLLMALVMVVSMLPMSIFTAFAADDTADAVTLPSTLYVGGTAVISDGVVGSVTSGTGWRYDTSTATLYLTDGANIRYTSTEDDFLKSGIYCVGTLNIHASGTVTITGYTYGIYLSGLSLNLYAEEGANVTVSAVQTEKTECGGIYTIGDNVVTALSGRGTVNVYSPAEIYSRGLAAVRGTIRVDGITLNARGGGSCADISADNLLCIGKTEAAVVNCIGSSGGGISDLTSAGSVEIYNGSIVHIGAKEMNSAWMTGISVTNIKVSDSCLIMDGLKGTSSTYALHGLTQVVGNSHILIRNIEATSGASTYGLTTGTEGYYELNAEQDYYCRTDPAADFALNAEVQEIGITYFELYTAAHHGYHSNGDGTHYYGCPADCPAAIKGENEACSGTVTCTEKAVCETCGESYGEPLGHSFGTDGSCTACGTAAGAKVVSSSATTYYLTLPEALAAAADEENVYALADYDGDLTIGYVFFYGEGYTFSGAVTSEGFIDGGTFNGAVTNNYRINSGIFNGTVMNNHSIHGGTFNGSVTNCYMIFGGTFNSSVANNSGWLIQGGVFEGEVTNEGTIDSGTFNGTVYNYGVIDGGTFNDHVVNTAASEILNNVSAAAFTLGENFSIANEGTIKCTYHHWKDGTCRLCTTTCPHEDSAHETTTDNGDGTHGFTCTVCGGTVTEGHGGGNPTCTTSDACAACGADYLDPDNHEYVNGICPCGAIASIEKNANGVYEIANKYQLVEFAQIVNGTHETIPQDKAANAILMADIDMTGIEWTPICSTGLYYSNSYASGYGTADTGYAGTFDGDGHVIKNLSVTAIANETWTYGLFGTMTGTVKNLGIEGFTYNHNGASDMRVGAIVGQNLGGTIENCYVVKATITPGTNVAGGITGCNYAGTIRNCYVADSTVLASDTRYGYIAGDNRADTAGDRVGTIENCYTDAGPIVGSYTGTETNSKYSVNHNYFTNGGVVWYLNGQSEGGIWKQGETHPNFTGMAVTQPVLSSYTEPKQVNGVYQITNESNLRWFAEYVNMVDSSVSAVLANNITMEGDNWIPIGSEQSPYTGTFDGQGYAITGFTMNITGSGYHGLFGVIQDATVKNFSIDGQATTNNTADGGYFGVIGLAKAVNAYCYVEDIRSTVDYIVKDGYNKQGVGGIVGYAAGTSSSPWQHVAIARCSYGGTIDLGSAFGDCTGGIVGYVAYNSTVRTVNCLFDGTIHADYTDTLQVGGIMGYNRGANCMMFGCLSIGKIDVPNTTFAGQLAGRYLQTNDAGRVDTVMRNNHYYSENGLPAVGTSTGMTYSDIEMSKFSTFGTDNAQAVTKAQLASGEVAYLLAKESYRATDGTTQAAGAWGQTIGTDAHPVIGGETVYQIKNCKNDTIYSNTNENIGHIYAGSSICTVCGAECVHNSYDANGFCTVCGGYQPAAQNTEGVYEISNAGQLYWFAAVVNGGYGDVAQNEAANAVLTTNIEINKNLLSSLTYDENGNVTNGDSFRVWTPIGNDTNRYTGTFDGNNKTVSGLYFNGSDTDCVGLFGYVGSGGTVKNVGVIDSYLNGSYYVGGVVGVNYGTVANCYNTGSVSGSDYVGGVVGENYGTVANCYNTGSVSGIDYVGSVVGNNDDTVTNCYYLSGTAAGGITGSDVTGSAEVKTADEFKSGEVAYLLQSGQTAGEDGVIPQVWGQYLDNGKTVQTIPSFAGATVYVVVNCKGEISGYSNTEGRIIHIYDANGFCTLCDAYEPAVLTTDKYDVNGDEVMDKVYEISNAGQLYWFAAVVNGGYGDVAQNTTANAVLTTNIEINKNLLSSLTYDENGNVTNGDSFRVWTPIGSSTYIYFGIFDGNNKTVSGLYFNNSDTEYVGLFGGSSEMIKNVGVIDSYLNGSDRVGGVVGMSAGTVVNCYNTGTVTGDYVGGVVGDNRDTVQNCYNTGTVTGGDNSNPGGVVGSNNSGTVENCHNSGTVTGGANSDPSGVVSINYDMVQNCYNTGTVSDTAVDGRSRVSGVVSTNYGMVQNCYNTGTVSGRMPGGVVAYNGSDGTVENCYNTGTVSGTFIEVGGVVGDNNGGTVENCYNTGTVSGTSNFVGGVAGDNAGTIQNCYNTGTVSGIEYVGGVVGYMYGGTVKNCYNTSSVSGTSDYGGVVGFHNAGTVQNCYFNTDTYTGNAIGTNKSTVDGLTGGKTAAQFASGEVAYLLQAGQTAGEDGTIPEVWGQDLDNGKTPQTYPTFTGAKVYQVLTCNGETTAYSNTNANNDHTYDNACDTDCNVCDEERTVGDHVPNADDGDCTTAVLCVHCKHVCVEAKDAHTPAEDDGDCTTAVYCTECEQIAIAAKDAHTPGEDDGNCTTAVYCTDCDQIVTPAKEAHTPGEDDGDCTTDILCNFCGQVAAPGNEDHSWQDATCAAPKTCTVCGTTEGEPLGHNDEDNSGRCDTCNCLMQPALLRMVSISLKGNIAINYYMLLSDEVLADSTAYMQFTMADGEIIQIPVSEGVQQVRNGETYYVFSCAVNAKEMTDDVVSQFFYEGGSTAEHTYSVKTYADHILANSTDEEMKDLVTAMLNYGAASQIHFGYNTDNMANAGLVAPDYSGVTIEGFNAVAGQGTELAKLYSASLILKSETTLRFFFQVDSSAAFTATYNGQALEVKQRSGLYYVDVVGIAAKDLDENVTITINDGTNTAEVSFNPMSYCQGVLNDTTGAFDQEMKDLVAALYLYNQAANVYFKES